MGREYTPSPRLEQDDEMLMFPRFRPISMFEGSMRCSLLLHSKIWKGPKILSMTPRHALLSSEIHDIIAYRSEASSRRPRSLLRINFLRSVERQKGTVTLTYGPQVNRRQGISAILERSY